jgi:hypothetical protein
MIEGLRTGSITAQQYTLVAGAANAQLIGSSAFVADRVVARVSGGTLIIIGVPAGQTLSAAQLAAAFTANQFYIVKTAERLDFLGPAPFYIAGIGATVVAQVMSLKSS